ncbi:PREDICTED: uncharacterized protein LOC109590101 [Amphimedon queenslandica]|uniref:Death domain-containing protein n=1 Tax=Amphimedon queenslandica TaxID=400682 RepID=A0AAN0JXC9_AMPQE|nr:PREDICTED: uncharacterized protein LOC109590101 [Amphimedon queenslandica]|eukprot:XP_019861600.1 PREDICTED: uncharacterized protein LOC109590101 [Amphimedon queenslandica]
MSLHVYIQKKKYTVDIINRYTHIEIRFDCKEACLQIRKLVTEAIKKSSKNLKVNTDYIFAFKCSMDEQCYCIVHNKSSASCTHCRLQCKVLESDDSYRCWFSDELASPTGAEPTLKVPPIKKNRTTPLSASDLVDIRDLLEKHGYSGVDYYDLGLRLGLLPRTLDVIENENKGNVRTGLRECLKAWLQQADNVKSKGVPTYDILIQALRDEKKNAVADGIKKELDD